MKKIAVMITALALAGCVQVDNYRDVVKLPSPASLVGYWQSTGPQSELVSPEAMASLIVTPEGDTLDCRQWQRTTAVPGKLALLSGDLQNVTSQLDVYDIEQSGDNLDYAGMSLHRVSRPTNECLIALAKQPFASDAIKQQAQIVADQLDPNAATTPPPVIPGDSSSSGAENAPTASSE